MILLISGYLEADTLSTSSQCQSTLSLSHLIAVAGESQRTVTRNIVSRIPAKIMEKVLEVCRSESVTFTAL